MNANRTEPPAFEGACRFLIELGTVARGRQHSHFARMPASAFNMAKLVLVSELVDRLEAGTLTMAEGASRLKSVSQQPPIYGRWPWATRCPLRVLPC